MYKNVSAYCRVSTDNADQLHSLAAQIKYFTEYIGSQEGWRLKEVYYDEGLSATSTKKRKSFNRMITDAENGQVDLILTKEVSRFARNTIDTLSYTRKLTELGVGVIFTNDGIDTRDKDGELRLTIMASIAQEESRKTSERVKWGIKRKMEDGWVYGRKEMLGYRVENGELKIEPEEAEIVRKIFHSYVHENKGCHTIANDLNAAGLLTVKGKMWREDGVCRILKNDKYVGDLTQWKHYSTDFISKKVLKNDGDNPDVPLIKVSDHHEPIIGRDTWNAAQEIIDKRGKLIRERVKHSSSYWYSTKVFCGMCKYTFNVGGQKSLANRTLRCVNRQKYGSEARVDANGAEVGCDNKGVNEKVLAHCMEYIIGQIQNTQEEIIKDLLVEIKSMQKETKIIDTKVFEDEIENVNNKKRQAIDLLLEGLISKEDLKSQTAFYDSEIVRLNEEIFKSQNVNHTHENQIGKVKEYISRVKKTAKINDYNTDVFGELLERVVVNENDVVDFYLNCVPFGFRISYHTKRLIVKKIFEVYIDSCDIIE